MDFEKMYQHYVIADHIDSVITWLEKYGYDFVEEERRGYDVTHIIDTLSTLVYVLRDRK